MKKFTKVISMILIAAIISSVIVYQQAEAKDIYFAGKYTCTEGKLTLKQYSSPKNAAYGKNVGRFTFSGFTNRNKNTSGELYKKGKNKYQTREGFITFIVKKKSVIVKGGPIDWTTEKQYSLKGTYKLKKRYSS